MRREGCLALSRVCCNAMDRNELREWADTGGRVVRQGSSSERAE